MMSPCRPPAKTLGALLLFSALLSLLSFGAALNRGLVIFPGWTTASLAGIEPELGFAYRAPTGHPELSAHERSSPAEVWEDGQTLSGPANSQHDNIRRIGQGRYSFWRGYVYFSTSDNSDPRTNGRCYEIRFPRTLPAGLAYGLYATTVAVVAGAMRFASRRRELPEIRAVLQKGAQTLSSFVFSASLVVAIFLVTRLPFFLLYPVVGFAPDTGGYAALAEAVKQGQWPLFVLRTPGYPFLIWLVTSCVDRWMAVAVVQCLFLLAAGLSLVYSVHRLRRGLTLPAALAVGAFLGSSQALIYDATALSDSMYTSSLVFSVAFLLLAFGRSQPGWFAAASAAMASAILVRPAGMFLFVIYLLVLAYLFRNRFGRRSILFFALPFPAILLVLCAYNRFTLGAFVISPFGEENLAAATLLYWEPDPSLPPHVNRALEELPESYRRAGVTAEDLQLLQTSWNAGALFNVFSRTYNTLAHREGWASGARFGPGGYLQNRADLRQVCLVAIRRHPAAYAKFVWANLVAFFDAIELRFDFYSAVADWAVQDYAGSARVADHRYDKEYLHSAPPPSITINRGGGPADVRLALPFLRRLHLAWQSWQERLCQRICWVWLYFLTLFLSLFELIRSRGRHLGAFLLCLLTLMVLGASLVTCLVEEALDRYSYPTQFIYFLLAALLPLLWTKLQPRGDAK